MEELKSYIAGVLDSGCTITIEKQGNSYRVVVELSRKSKECLDVIRMAYGGTLNSFGESHRIRIKSDKARKLVREIGPLMKTKKKEREIILQLDTMVSRTNYAGAREALYKCIRGELPWFN